MKPIKVSDAELAFGGDMNKLLPPMNYIPDEFKESNNKWVELVSGWFFSGLPEGMSFSKKEGVDPKMAINHVRAIMSSFAPKHQHKEAGCAYLMSEFFNDFTYPEKGR